MLSLTKRIGTFHTRDGAVLYYVTLGSGDFPIAVIPGASDGLATLDQTATRLSLYFAKRQKHYRLLILSRRQPVPDHFGLEHHAEDMLEVMRSLKWPACILECNSAGGPIGQHIAIRSPEQVRGLILSSTLHRSNSKTGSVVQYWLDLITRQKWAEFTWSSIKLTFRPRTVRRYGLFRPLLSWLSPPPRDPTRIRHVLQELLDFDNRPLLPESPVRRLLQGALKIRLFPLKFRPKWPG